MKKIDFKKELKHLYSPSAKEAAIIEVPKMDFLMVDGQGDPNTAQEYKDAIEALYAVSYALKFMIKKGGDVDYVVMPLEGLWWTEDMTKFTIGKQRRVEMDINDYAATLCDPRTSPKGSQAS